MEPTDIELMLRVRTGEIEAFRLLVTRYREPLRRFFAMLLADRSEADDCTQETLLRLWLLRERYEPTGKFSTYLFQIGKHHLLNQRKKYRAAPITTLENDALELLPATGPPLELVVMQEEENSTPGRGDIGVLGNEDGRKNVEFLPDAADLPAFAEVMSLKDEFGYRDLVGEGKVLLLPAGTEAKFLRKEAPDAYCVRILDGDHAGRIGFVLRQQLRSMHQDDRPFPPDVA
jgi:RNA polymerase sigma factor (sigma-70 family)